MNVLDFVTSTEVPVMWLAGIAALIFGWRIAKKGVAMTWEVGKKFGYGMLAASTMMIAGLGGVGFGIGDLATRSSNEPLREVDSMGQEIDTEYVKFDGVIARLDKETKMLYPVSIETEDQRKDWDRMSDGERKLVWDIVRQQPAVDLQKAERNWTAEAQTVAYEADPPFEPLAPTVAATSIDKPALGLQATWSIIFGSLGLIATSFVTFTRRVGNGKFNTPVRDV